MAGHPKGETGSAERAELGLPWISIKQPRCIKSIVLVSIVSFRCVGGGNGFDCDGDRSARSNNLADYRLKYSGLGHRGPDPGIGHEAYKARVVEIATYISIGDLTSSPRPS